MSAPETEPVPAPETSPPGRRRGPRLAILLGFLGVFLLLLIVFREVLFPFLMAVFLAYLIEPIVRWVKARRIFGKRWGRGPIVVLLYALIVGGLGYGIWKAATWTAMKVRTTARSVAAEIEREGGRATVEVLRESEAAEVHALRLARGSTLHFGSADRRLVYRTLHDVVVEPKARKASVLLDLIEPVQGAPRPQPGDALLLAQDAALAWVDAEGSPRAHVRVTGGEPPQGAELYLERKLLGPIAENLAKADIDPNLDDVRDFVELKASALSEDLPDRVTRTAFTWAGKIALSIYEFFLILMITAFMVMDRKRIGRFFASLPPPHLEGPYRKLISYVDDGLAGVIRGQLFICMTNGVLTYLGLVILGVKGAGVLAGMAAVLSLIPIFGTILSSIPIVLIASTKSIETGVLALAWIVLIHVLEANLLNPLIMGSQAQMHPLVIIFALLAGEHYFGVWGALLAVPTASIVQSCFLFYLYEIEGREPAPPKPHGQGLARVWSWIRGIFGKRPATGA